MGGCRRAVVVKRLFASLKLKKLLARLSIVTLSPGKQTAYAAG